jgi:flagellar basal-body rod protein FlgF
MDRLIYIAGSGAKQVLERQATTTNNLANATTTGFRTQIDSFRAVPVIGEGLPTRAFVVDSTVGSDFSPGPIQETGRDLDVAIQGKGWIALETPDGKEAYTRHGSFKISENGILQSHDGNNVVGESGPISIPPDVKIAIAKDGTVSGIPTSGQASVNVIGKIKLVNPPDADMERRDDGLYRVKNSDSVDPDPTVVVVGGALEGSNVNIVDSMVTMISLARQFEMQMKMLQTAEANANKAGQLLSLT